MPAWWIEATDWSEAARKRREAEARRTRKGWDRMRREFAAKRAAR